MRLANVRVRVIYIFAAFIKKQYKNKATGNYLYDSSFFNALK